MLAMEGILQQVEKLPFVKTREKEQVNPVHQRASGNPPVVGKRPAAVRSGNQFRFDRSSHFGGRCLRTEIFLPSQGSEKGAAACLLIRILIVNALEKKPMLLFNTAAGLHRRRAVHFMPGKA